MATTTTTMGNTSMSWLESYDRLWELRDKRVDDWPFMSSPWPTITLSAVYVYGVTVLGPTFMRDRQPFELKRTLMVYNLFQVLVSAYIVYEAAAAGWATHYNWMCQDVERSPDPSGPGMRMASVVWVYFMTKFTEFLDTVFFVARKKFANVSVLQVFHHGIMPIFSFCLCRWLPGGHESFGGLLNALVHVVMYSYYFLAALGPSFQKYLWWKKYLTSFQMIQFSVIFIKSLLVISGTVKCGYPWQFSAITATLMVLFFILFAQFFVQEYTRKGKGKSSQKKAQ